MCRVCGGEASTGSRDCLLPRKAGLQQLLQVARGRVAVGLLQRKGVLSLSQGRERRNQGHGSKLQGTPWWPACLPGPREPRRRVKHWRGWSTQLAAVQGQAGSRHPAQLAPSGSCTQWMPVFTGTAVAFVHSSLKHQLEDAGRGRGLPDGDMAAKQAGLPSSGQGGREAAPGPSLPPVALTSPSCRG